jgi:exportin-1
MYCDFILSKAQSTYTKIISLGILEDVIKAKWLLLPQDQRMGIRNFLVDLLIKNVTDDQSFQSNTHFINKLNYIIVLIAKYEWTTTWPTFISEICSSSKTNQNLCENNLKLLQMLK